MSRLAISTGTSPNDGLGDTILNGVIKINSNFIEIYNCIGNGTTITNSIGYASSAGIATYATSAGIATNATYATNAGIATYASSSGIATTAQGLTGTPNLNVGIVTATSFVGDGSGLTGIVGSGGGVVVKDSGTTVGTAGTIDFGDNLTVSTISAGIVTVTGSAGGGSSQFVTTAAGIHTLSNVGIGTTNPTSALTVSGDVKVTGIITASSFSGNASSATYATSSGIATYSSNAGIATFATSAGIATYATSAGIATYSSNAGIATYATNAGIATYATSAGISTIATYATSAGISTYATNAGIATYATNSGISTFATSAGIATYTSEWILGANGSSDYTFTGPGLIGAENDPVLYLVRGQQYKFTNTMGMHPFRIQSTVNGSTGSQYNDGITNNDVSNGTLTWNVQFDAPNILYYQCTAHGGMGGKIYIIDAGIGPDISINTTGIITASSFSGNASSATYATNSGIATNAQGLTGTPNIIVGIITATSFVGSGTNLTGIVTSIVAGTNVTISGSTGQVTINASGGGSSQFVTTAAGIHTLSNVGIGTTNPQGTLQVGTGITMYGSTGIISATTFVGSFSGSITNATNLTGGYANASQLNVSGVTTISQGRIQADGSSNLRFGNLAAGSGSGRNIAIGDQVLYSLNSGQGRNIGIGELSYYDTTSGQYNIGLGIQAGQKITTGNYNVILGGYDGQTGLDIRTSSNNVVIADGQGNIRQYINSSGNVGIKTTVITEALTVSGIVSATSFYGTLNAGQLTGSLPAIDGSALIGVIASGTGIIIQDDTTPVGTAGTINFGSNINVTFASGIATVSGNGLATYANVAGIATYATTAGVSTTSGTANYATNAGVSTTSGTAGYATTAGISSAVSASININTTGIITASSFSGSGSGLTNLPAAQLTGTLPAIDGSQLLNVTAAGTGIAIRDDNASVGSATTVNFGTGLDVTFSAGIATITASGGSLQSRTTVSGVTTSIANLGIGNTNITGFKSYALMKVGLSTTGWLRLYTDNTSRANDAFRSVGEDPAPGSGVIAEVVTTGITTTQIISPFVMGGNLNNPADTTIYASIKNLSGSTQTITANLTILQLEA